MKRDISAEEFEKMSNEAKKRYVVSLIIREAKSMPVESPEFPIAIVMAGVPGAGKTEYLDSLEDTLKKEGNFNPFVRIDLDQIVTVYPDYTPKTYNKFRSQGNNLLARCIDELRRRKYNVMIDGTFSGTSGSSVRNIEKLLDNGYKVSLMRQRHGAILRVERLKRITASIETGLLHHAQIYP
jgi:predicted ABC-type ATPase